MLRVTPLYRPIARTDAKVGFHLALTNEAEEPLPSVVIQADLVLGDGILLLNPAQTDAQGVCYAELQAPVPPGAKSIRWQAPGEKPLFTHFKVFTPGEADVL